MSQFTIKIILGSVIFTENKERALNCCGLSSEIFTEKKKRKKERKNQKKMERKNSTGSNLSKMSRRFYSMGSQVNISEGFGQN